MTYDEDTKRDIKLLYVLCVISLLLNIWNLEGMKSKGEVFTISETGRIYDDMWEKDNYLNNQIRHFDSTVSKLEEHISIPHAYGSRRVVHKERPLF